MALHLVIEQQRITNEGQNVEEFSSQQKNRILRRPSVELLIGLSRSTIYSMMASGDFPKPVQLGKRAVGWREAEIRKWLESRLESGTA